uniref:Uncharacterized protein n=1 Tax=Glossina pallidipes TaxID=7398 RepID=A0A1A9ZVH9_GLOPL
MNESNTRHYYHLKPQNAKSKKEGKPALLQTSEAYQLSSLPSTQPISRITESKRLNVPFILITGFSVALNLIWLHLLMFYFSCLYKYRNNLPLVYYIEAYDLKKLLLQAWL